MSDLVSFGGGGLLIVKVIINKNFGTFSQMILTMTFCFVCGTGYFVFKVNTFV